MTTSEVSVRFASLDDLQFVQQDRYVSIDVVRHKIEWQEVVVAELNGGLVGYARLEYLWSILPYITLIRVLPDYQRQGVGKAMVGYIETYLRDKGHAALYSSSQADEAEAQAWHRQMGFEECGIIAGINRGGIGEIFFRKQLR